MVTLSFIALHTLKNCLIYEKVINAQQKRYNNADKLSRILPKWKSMRFTEELLKSAHDSEIEVFRKFVAKSMSLQEQLHPNNTSKSK